MEFVSQKNLRNEIVKVLSDNNRVIFAYLYGSFSYGNRGNDIDIGIYSQADEDPYSLSADLKIELHHISRKGAKAQRRIENLASWRLERSGRENYEG
jgi:predicted nucleotidyltransferase